jgi:hypothetical protein
MKVTSFKGIKTTRMSKEERNSIVENLELGTQYCAYKSLNNDCKAKSKS